MGDLAPHKGPMEHKVHEYLRKNYPDDLTEWTCRSAWEKTKVPLDRIAFGRRPGGKDPAKVDKFAARFGDKKKAKKLKRVVVVDAGGQGKMVVADGYHRCAGASKAGKKKIRAYVGTPRIGAGNWRTDIAKMQAAVFNRSGPEDQGGA